MPGLLKTKHGDVVCGGTHGGNKRFHRHNSESRAISCPFLYIQERVNDKVYHRLSLLNLILDFVLKDEIQTQESTFS